MSTINVMAELQTETCCNCGMLFAMPGDIQRKRQAEGGTFYCPNGHSQHYAKSEVEKLRVQLEATNRDLLAARNRECSEREQRQAAENERDKIKRASIRMKKRVSAGVCPCCNRTFENIQRHMHTKHPDFSNP